MESIIQFLQSINPLLVYATLFGIAFIENIFPPSPSDMVIVFGGTLIGIGRIGFPAALFWSTAGSTAGFLVMYKIGDLFGVRILEAGKLSFIPADAVHKVEGWFKRYGYWIIIANRFLAGTRAVVSFFAGMSELNLPRTTLLCAASALAWNALLLTGGYYLGQNWERIGFYLGAYSEIVTGIVLLAAIFFVVQYLRNRQKEKKAA